MMQAPSLGRRLALAMLGLTAVVVGIAVFATWMAARWHLMHALDSELRARCGHLQRMFDHEQPAFPPPPPPPNDHHLYLEVRSVATDQVLLRSPNLTHASDSLRPRHAIGHHPYERRLEEGRPLRLMTFTVEHFSPPGPFPQPATAAQIMLGIDMGPVAGELDRLAGLLLGVWLLATVLAAVLGWWLRRLVLAPLERLSAAIRAIDPEQPGAGIQAQVPTEMTDVVARLDHLLHQLDAVLSREKATLAAIAHELRTPVAGVRAALEFALLAEPPPPGDALARRCLPTVSGLQGLIANLLALARIEAGSEPVHRRPVEVPALLDQAWNDVAPLAESRGITRVLAPGMPPPWISTCPDKLRLVLVNLLGNAVDHGAPGTAITLTCVSSPERFELSCRNRMVGPPPDLSRLFTPFWRGDVARTSGAGHCGLGLALARRVMVLLGGGIAAELDGGDFVVRLWLPSA